MRTRTLDGRISVYGFACGYVEKQTANNLEKQLYKDGCFHVRVIELTDEGKFLSRLMWASFDNLTAARQVFDGFNLSWNETEVEKYIDKIMEKQA